MVNVGCARSRYGTAIGSATSASASAIAAPPAWSVVRSGAAQAIPPTPATIAATASHSRIPGASPSRVTPSQSSRINPLARQGCTTVSGASSSATISNGHPTSPSAVAPSQRLFRTSLPINETRSECSSGTSRASNACKAIEVL